MQYQFVLWGIGTRGKRFLRICPHNKIVAIIDSNEELQGTSFDEIPVISYDDYRNNYFEYDILLTMMGGEVLRSKLEEDEIYNVWLLEECPSLLKSIPEGMWLDELPLDLTKPPYVIYGLNLYSFLLREYIAQICGDFPDIIPEENDKVSRAFMEKYSCIKSRKAYPGETIVWASSYQIEDTIENNVIDAFDFMGRIEKFRNQDLSRFKNIANNKRCFLVGNGPSVRIEDLDTLQKHDEDSFGVNQVYKIFSNTVWRPKYYLLFDMLFIDSCTAAMENYPQCTVFYPDSDAEVNKKRKNDKQMLKFHVQMLPYIGNGICKFSDDIVNGIYQVGTVIYGCLQLAAYMGYKEIYLIGVDNNYKGKSQNEGNHFIKNYVAKDAITGVAYPEYREKAYMAAKTYADSHNIKIYNATRGGKLEVFDRVNFDSLFDK